MSDSKRFALSHLLTFSKFQSQLNNNNANSIPKAGLNFGHWFGDSIWDFGIFACFCINYKLRRWTFSVIISWSSRQQMFVSVKLIKFSLMFTYTNYLPLCCTVCTLTYIRISCIVRQNLFLINLWKLHIVPLLFVNWFTVQCMYPH